jgi:hypothetical protein
MFAFTLDESIGHWLSLKSNICHTLIAVVSIAHTVFTLCVTVCASSSVCWLKLACICACVILDRLSLTGVLVIHELHLKSVHALTFEVLNFHFFVSISWSRHNCLYIVTVRHKIASAVTFSTLPRLVFTSQAILITGHTKLSVFVEVRPIFALTFEPVELKLVVAFNALVL